MTPAEVSDYAAMSAQAELHHQYLLGLELMVAANERPGAVGEWMRRLFRRLHEEKFLSSFRKLGLEGLPDAVACARYHTLSNVIGGVPVEYMEESDRKAWVRFRYPRWMFDGPAICGMPVEAGRGFLRGWYARNGLALNNPRLGFVCVSEDMTDQFGFCGYFREYDRELAEDERLVFAPDERPPPFDPDRQPAAPEADWSEERLAKANRNYAAEFIRNGIRELVGTIGEAKALEHGRRRPTDRPAAVPPDGRGRGRRGRRAEGGGGLPRRHVRGHGRWRRGAGRRGRRRRAAPDGPQDRARHCRCRARQPAGLLDRALARRRRLPPPVHGGRSRRPGRQPALDDPPGLKEHGPCLRGLSALGFM